MEKKSIYYDLAWTQPVLSSFKDYEEEVTYICRLIKDHSKKPPKTLLHLGCGAGMHDYTFKKHFTVTGVDLSEGMLEVAKRNNPEITYIPGDMRNVKLKRRYDVVTIPDSIGYMITEEDLKKTLHTANDHLKPGGVLLIITHTREEFRENNFVYTGSKDDIAITVFEHNYIPDKAGTTYKAVFIYLIRQKGIVNIYNDCHTIGMYPIDTWMQLFNDIGCEVKRTELNDLYDPYLMGDGEYRLSVFICMKPL